MIRSFLALAVAALFVAAPAVRAEAPKAIPVVITDDGVNPDRIPAKAGQPVQLAVTRKTDKTCITRLVQQDLKIDKELPLNKTVLVEFTPKASGKVKFVCGMGMDVATVVVN